MTMKRALYLAAICGLLITAAGAQQVQLSTGYLYQGSNRVPGASDWFGAHGGRADVSVGNWHNFALAAEFTREHAANLTSSGQGLTTYTYMAGPRYTLPFGRAEKRRVSVFVQALLGGVHASDSVFPNGASTQSTADGFALSAGGGVETRLKRAFALRLIQADYLYTRLPNANANYESSFRLGAGVVFRLR